MNIRKIIHALLCFFLPGITAGWIFSVKIFPYGHDLVVGSVIFSAFALAGAVAGRWLLKSKTMLGFALLSLLILPIFSTQILFAGTAFAFAVFAVRPVRPVNRLFFQAGVLFAVIIALTESVTLARIHIWTSFSLALLLPATASLLSTASTCRKTTYILTCITGLILLALPWKAPAGLQKNMPWGEQVVLIRSQHPEQSTQLRIGNRQYQLPRDLERDMPDLLTAALQSSAENVRVFVLGEVPDRAKPYLQKYPEWIEEIQTGFLATDQDVLSVTPQNPCDLIFVHELPGNTEAGNLCLLRLQRTILAPGGILTAPTKYTLNNPDFRSILLPGSAGRFRVWAEKTTPLAAAFSELETRLAARGGSTAGSLSGIMQTLYELRPAEPDHQITDRTPLARGIQYIQGILQKSRLVLPGAVLLLLGICWFSRSPRYGDNFAIFIHGTACMLGLITILQMAGKYQLLLPTIPLTVFFGLIAMALPHRSEHARKWRIPAMICMAAAGWMLFTGVCGEFLTRPDIPEWTAGVLLLPTLFLMAPALRFGSIHKGGESARYLHFAGLLAGSLLALAAPEWTALLTALLLLAA